jgi:hypothetical protein
MGNKKLINWLYIIKFLDIEIIFIFEEKKILLTNKRKNLFYV